MPRGGRDQLDGWAHDASGRTFLKARVSAAPVDGQANAALLRLLANSLGRPASALRLVGGEGARIKLIEVEGLTPKDLALRLTAALAG